MFWRNIHSCRLWDFSLDESQNLFVCKMRNSDILRRNLRMSPWIFNRNNFPRATSAYKFIVFIRVKELAKRHSDLNLESVYLLKRLQLKIIELKMQTGNGKVDNLTTKMSSSQENCLINCRHKISHMKSQLKSKSACEPKEFIQLV